MAELSTHDNIWVHKMVHESLFRKIVLDQETSRRHRVSVGIVKGSRVYIVEHKVRSSPDVEG